MGNATRLYLGIALIGILATPKVSIAGLNVKNDTQHKVYVTVAFWEPAEIRNSHGFGLNGDGSAWRIIGWYPVNPGQTKEVISGDLKQYSSNIYWCADRVDGAKYSGSTNLKIHPNKAFDFSLTDGGEYLVSKQGLGLAGDELLQQSVVRGFHHIVNKGNSSITQVLGP